MGRTKKNKMMVYWRCHCATVKIRQRNLRNRWRCKTKGRWCYATIVTWWGESCTPSNLSIHVCVCVCVYMLYTQVRVMVTSKGNLWARSFTLHACTSRWVIQLQIGVRVSKILVRCQGTRAYWWEVGYWNKIFMEQDAEQGITGVLLQQNHKWTSC